MNAEEMLTVVGEIEAAVERNPLAFDMHDWLSDGSCGTVGCYAAFAMTPEQQVAWLQGYLSAESPWHVAATRFDLDDSYRGDGSVSEADRLFLIGSWPRDFEWCYNRAANSKDRVAVLRARVEHFISTGE
jgi:hypothetical protein